jgi:group I intron endonuclease
MIIYLLSFPNGKHYVGRTKNSLEQRLIEHKTRATKNYQHPLYYAINKYGWDNIGKDKLCTISTEEELVLKELEFIKKYNSLQNGYNLTLNTEIGGDNWKGRRDTEEYQQFLSKMRELRLGEGNGMFGKTHTQEASDKMKEKAKGRFSLEWFQHRNGIEEGEKLYKARCLSLKNRKYKDMKDPATGQFKKKV